HSEISVLQASAEALPLPTDYTIGPNFPNPFNPDTRFELKLPETGKVSIVIYNALGREVTRVLDEAVLEAGIHQLSWNGQNAYGAAVPSGIYFGMLKTEGTQRIMKMLLLK
ncbi:T9SS type A sorting domain-containing protein, partial [bacterium]|nr:T9SS type A sorting domain-containing protein [bacterium]